MKSILKIFSSLLLTFTLFLGFTGAASAYPYPTCDLVNNYSCPPENLDVYDVLLVDIPSNNEVVLDIAPFVLDSPYKVNYNLGAGRNVEDCKDDWCQIIEETTDEPDNGFVQNITNDNPQIINVTVSKKY